MAYHVGRIVGRRLGLDPVAVQVNAETATGGAFDYPEAFPIVPLADLLEVATPNDVLVCNPLWSGQLFGLRFPGRTLMYVQAVSTYRIIDGFCDHYAATSSFVHDHLALHYGWDVPVIPPFVHTDRIGPTTPWEQRPVASVLVPLKSLGPELFAEVQLRMAARHPETEVSFTVVSGVGHRDLLAQMQRHRYLLALNPLEGYGLMPVEAMLSGCCIVGFHGGGGLDVLCPGVNAEVVGYPRLDAVVDGLAHLIAVPALAAAMAGRGRASAAGHDYACFEQRWAHFAATHMVG